MTGRVAGSRAFRAYSAPTQRDGTTRRDLVVQRICAVALLLAGGMHIAVGLEHAGSNFGALSFAAGIAQGALGALVFLRAAGVSLQAVVIMNVALIQLYALNVTLGLPPMISHSHIGGTHQVWLFTLAWPGALDARGVVTVAMEIVGIACAMWLAGRHDRARSFARPVRKSGLARMSSRGAPNVSEPEAIGEH